MKSLRKTLEDRRLNAAAGGLLLWVALGPWVWGYASSPAAVASHVFFIFAFGPLTLLTAVLRPAAYVVFAAALWLAASPWVLGYALNHSAWLSELVTGAPLSVFRRPYRCRRPSASDRRVCEVDLGRGGLRAPLGARIRRLLQVGLRRPPKLAAHHTGCPARAGREHHPLARADKADHGGKREHHRRPRRGYHRRLEARRCGS